jgi:amidohydrolase
MALHDDVLALQPEIVALRREVHQDPELAFEERSTARRVTAFLEGRGLTLRPVARTGVVATARPEAGRGPVVLLRVDMDGLPIQEQNEVPYASRNPGVMHACGHDGHVAMGAGAARLLPSRRLPGEVRVLFQPAEEGEGGAQAVLADGALEGVGTVLGVHLWNELPVGTLGVKAGPLMAAVDRLRIVIRGRGGHGAQPHRAADPIVAAAHVITALQTVVAREVSPVQPAVVTIGAVRGGEAFNVIPDEVVLMGTIRTFDAELRRSMPDRLRRIVGGVAEALQCRAEVEVKPGNPAVINDARVAEIAGRAAARVVGEKGVVSPEPTMGGEDMALYFERVPGCFVFVGSASPERGLAEPHHSPRFDFDERALAIGCEFLLEAAAEAMAAGLSS